MVLIVDLYIRVTIAFCKPIAKSRPEHSRIEQTEHASGTDMLTTNRMRVSITIGTT